MNEANEVIAERERICAQYTRRTREVPPDLYAEWQPWTRLMVEERTLLARQMVQGAGALPRPGDRCLEIGCGAGGWLETARSWGFSETDLHGIDLLHWRLQQ